MICGAHDQRVEKLNEQFNQAQRIVLDNPMLASVITSQRLQKQIIEMVHKFATMLQLLLFLTIN
nr:hypothetical protein [Orientia tsutsugamushi]